MNEDDELIELARLAPPVPVKIESIGSKTRERNASSVLEFVSDIGLKPGKHDVIFKNIYNAYLEWATKPLTEQRVKKSFSEHFKQTEVGFKLNMKPITIMEIIKEIKHGKTVKDKTPSIKEE